MGFLAKTLSQGWVDQFISGRLDLSRRSDDGRPTATQHSGSAPVKEPRRRPVALLIGDTPNRAGVLGWTRGEHLDAARITTRTTVAPRQAHRRRRRRVVLRGGRRRCTKSGLRAWRKPECKDAHKRHQKCPHLAAKPLDGSLMAEGRQTSGFTAMAMLGLRSCGWELWRILGFGVARGKAARSTMTRFVGPGGAPRRAGPRPGRAQS
jgi:hypothetical protein